MGAGSVTRPDWAISFYCFAGTARLETGADEEADRSDRDRSYRTALRKLERWVRAEYTGSALTMFVATRRTFLKTAAASLAAPYAFAQSAKITNSPLGEN